MFGFSKKKKKEAYIRNEWLLLIIFSTRSVDLIMLEWYNVFKIGFTPYIFKVYLVKVTLLE